MSSIYYFPDDPPFSSRWEARLPMVGYRLLAYNPAQPPKVDTVLLLTSLLLEDKWIAPESVWKRYFEQNAPNVRLIQSGMQGNESRPNYLHLYAWPNDFSNFLQTSKTVSEWTPYPIGGTDLSDLIRFFFDGHGTDGFAEWKNKVQRVLSSLLYNLKEGKPVVEIQQWLNDPEKKHRFASMQGRWQHYNKVFTILPDSKCLKNIDDLLNKIDVEELILSPAETFPKKTFLCWELLKQTEDLLAPIQKLIE
ncbi:MAG TPA: hypothetical protein PLD02_10860 [Saprospiraceae bacterium]|nr:hypothetical protein [Saprospiraceae bacterium]